MSRSGKCRAWIGQDLTPILTTVTKIIIQFLLKVCYHLKVVDSSHMVGYAQVRKWDAETLEGRGKLKGHSGTVLSLAESRKRVYSGSCDSTIKVWGRKSGKCLSTSQDHQGPVGALAVANGHLFSGSDDGTMRCVHLLIHQNTGRVDTCHGLCTVEISSREGL
jgi:WD40 repeat protein